MKTLAIIGGGAAGLAAAVAAAHTARRGPHFNGPGHTLRHIQVSVQNLRIVIYEADDRVGRSILATGNGRCNFSNSRIDTLAPVYEDGSPVYRNQEFVDAVLNALESVVGHGETSVRPAYHNAVLAFFTHLGLIWREEAEGRLYPWANKASSVLDVLRSMAQHLGVEVRPDSCVKAIEHPHKPGSPITLRMANGEFQRCDSVIVACGGAVSETLLPQGFRFTNLEPMLGSLAIDNKIPRQLDGVRVKCCIELQSSSGLPSISEDGELLFRKYGVSGIAVFNLSRYAKPGDSLVIDLLPFLGSDEMEHFAAERLRSLGAFDDEMPTCADFLRGLVITPVADALLPLWKLDEHGPCNAKTASKLVKGLKSLTLKVKGIGDKQTCQIHRGGFDPDDFDTQTLEAYPFPNLYMTGEALDVDGPCGGYNLHWAWASGMLAGISSTRKLLRQPMNNPDAGNLGNSK